jgi:hypothetical protein
MIDVANLFDFNRDVFIHKNYVAIGK